MKFRVYDMTAEKYVTDDACFALTPDGKLIDTLTGNETKFSQFIVEFSSGTYDKNGTEIYEGDIVSMRGYNGKHLALVYFEKGKFAVDGSHYAFKDLAPKTYEVVGNKHIYQTE